jgi:hypothetical protein
MKKLLLLSLLAVMIALPVSAQNLVIKGVLQNNRYDDGDQLKSTWIGSLYDENGNYTGKTAFIVDYGIYQMTWDGSTLSTPEKNPAVNMSEIKQGNQVDYEKALWATNFNLMYGNSGAVYVDGKIVTVMSRDYQSTEDDVLFAVRKWDAKTGDLLNAVDEYHPVSANIESAGMAYNPKDGKVYGLFHITDAKLLDEVINDPDYYTDEDDQDWGREGLDDGYCIGTIDLKSMTITPITPGLYYQNFVAFAINSEGRAFALTSGGSNGVIGDDGKMRDIDNNLTGAQLIEFDLTTGLMIRNSKQVTDPETNETYTEYSYPLPATGYSSQVKRQAACFSKSNPNKLYWIGYYNSGKGINDLGSWSSLSDKEWRTNGKYDTALYEIDITTGEANRLAKVPNRASFCCLWVEGDDASDGANIEVTGIQQVQQTASASEQRVYNLQGQRVTNPAKGLFIQNGRKVVIK